METRSSDLLSISCAISVALVSITFCVVSGLCPVGGWTLGAMSFVALVSITGILHTHKEGLNGQERKG